MVLGVVDGLKNGELVMAGVVGGDVEIIIIIRKEEEEYRSFQFVFVFCLCIA